MFNIKTIKLSLLCSNFKGIELSCLPSTNGFIRMKSLDTLSLFYTSNEGVYDDEDFVIDLVRVKN